MANNYYKKAEKSFKKKHVKGNKFFLKKKRTKSINMLVRDIEIFLNMKKKHQYGCERYKNLLENECRKHFLQNARNKNYLSIKQFLLYLP